MILVDTNVVSEPMRGRGDPRVAAWLDRQAAETMFISTVSVAEVLFGVAALPAGKRRANLAEAFEVEVLPLFGGRILSFDLPAARAHAAVRSARGCGFSISVSEGQIAAIAATNGLIVATRDDAPFRAAGLETVNPWTD
jgi:toxin FitB